MMSKLGNFVELKISSIPEDCDLPNLLNLFLSVVQSQSFIVAIPVLVTWTHLLRSETIVESPTVSPLIAPLLQLCSSRLIRYESLPDDSDDPSLVLLLEDIDTIPERHAFLGNYRRYSVLVIELIVRRKTSDAVYHILSQVMYSLEHLYDKLPPFTPETYAKNSPALLEVDAQFTVVEAALKGYMKWRATQGSKPQQDESARVRMETDLEAWCERLLEMKFDDPIIRKRVLNLAVLFSTSALDKKPTFMLKVLEHVLMTQPVDKPECQAYSDAVKELQSDAMHELNRLAMKMPDQLLDVYEQLESKVAQIIATGHLDTKQQVSYQTFLFTILHRATRIDPTIRMQKLETFITPIKQLWQNPQLDASVENFETFCDLLGLTKVRNYLVSKRVHEVVDWSTMKLDAEGQALQAELNERVKSLPLRPTKSFLGCSTEKIEKDTEPYKVACALWTSLVPIILPDLLKFLSHAHAFHNPANWTGLPSEMQPIVSRILTDRFWQAGISGGSKDDFYARVSGTRATMEGLASSIRGSVRTVREACYAIMYGLSRLDVHFYGFEELPGPLANALFADCHCLSSHQLINLLALVRYLVDDCPVELRNHFVPPILATCFTQMDGKISLEWERLAQRQQVTSDEDALAEEMKEESILRQLTYTAVMLVATLFDPARPSKCAN
jgi:exportin-5